MKIPCKIAVSIAQDSIPRFLQRITEVNQNPLVDLIELRLDALHPSTLNFHLLKTLKGMSSKPLILTIRSVKEGGIYDIPVKSKFSLLKHAIQLEFDYIDVENSFPEHLKTWLLKNKQKTKIILSSHNFIGTVVQDLESKFFSMKAQNPDFIKIVSRAKTSMDAKTCVAFFKKYARMFPGLICFAMGKHGVQSRLESYLKGNSICYASLSQGEESAPGQLLYTDYLQYKEDNHA